jgi:predicted amidohydrolase
VPGRLVQRGHLPVARWHRWTYQKVNLATRERGRLQAGTELAVLPLDLEGGPLTAGVQICREIVFPEQWQHLADAGAQVFLYHTHAANPQVPAGVWRSHLISHAATNQGSSSRLTPPTPLSTAPA